MIQFFETRIKGTADFAPSTPPSSLGGFYWHYVRQTKWCYAAMVVSVLLVALMDLLIPVMIGRLTEFLQGADRLAALTAHWPQLAVMAGILLLLRPTVQLFDVAVRQNLLLPGATSLVRWQSHWHVVRQSWPFFQNDFAGRIANRIMQTPNALRESIMSAIRAGLFITTYGLSSLALMAWADLRLALPTFIWICAYITFLRYFVPRLLVLARISSEARSTTMRGW